MIKDRCLRMDKIFTAAGLLYSQQHDNFYKKICHNEIAMTAIELKKLIDLGESTLLEFKRKVTSPQKLAKEISALANTRGGHLLVGVDDDGSIYGCPSEKSEIDMLEQACGFWIEPPIEPQIEIINLYGKEILVARIEESQNKPHKLKIVQNGKKKPIYRAYIRIGEKSVEASREMARLMTYQTEDKPLRLSIGDKEKRLFAYLEGKESATVKDFSHLVNISERRAERLLIRLVRAGVLQIHNDTHRDYFTLI